MANSKQFVPVNFSQGQLLDTDTLNTLNSNEVYLRDNMVDGKLVNEFGGTWDTQIKMIGGFVHIPQQNVEVVYGTVGFPAMLTPGFRPAVATSILSPNGECKFEHVIMGIGTTFPDYRGFQFKVKINPAYNNRSFKFPIYLHYVALGA